MSRTRRALLLVLLNVVGIGLVVALFEGAGRLFLLLRPSYEVVFLQPDRRLGWKQVPNHRYTWTGSHWYAVDFSTPIEINSLGFRDRERSMPKPAGVVRVAMLGDSFVEAMQVPFEGTAAQLLERRLAEAPPRPGPVRYEVLNFGISNFSVGQYLLVFEEYARRFAPDYTVVFVGVKQMNRMVWKYELGGFPGTRETWLNVRPIFDLKDEALVREPADDFEAFVAAQREQIRSGFAGERSRVRTRSVLAHYRERWLPSEAAASLRRRPDRRRWSTTQILRINLRVLSELNRQVREAGGRMVLVDATEYFGDHAAPLSAALARFAARVDAGYVPLFEDLLSANQNGKATRWSHDRHFNEAGNEIFADAVFRWLRQHAEAAPD